MTNKNLFWHSVMTYVKIFLITNLYNASFIDVFYAILHLTKKSGVGCFLLHKRSMKNKHINKSYEQIKTYVKIFYGIFQETFCGLVWTEIKINLFNIYLKGHNLNITNYPLSLQQLFWILKVIVISCNSKIVNVNSIKNFPL